jgi:3-(3-hydroxy-phenyl)propionate hydroxylase
LYFSDSESIDPVVLELQDKLGVGEERFTLIIISKHSFILENIVVLHDRSGDLYSSYGAEEGSFYLLRPDRHIIARWKNINILEVMLAFKKIMSGGKSE